MRNLKTLLTVAAFLLLGTGVASAIPILDGWGFAVDSVFYWGGSVTGEYYNPSGATVGAGGIGAAITSATTGLTVIQQATDFDAAGLGSVTLGVQDGASHFVSMWMHYSFTDPNDPTDTPLVGNYFYIAANGVPLPGSAYTAQDYNSWPYYDWSAALPFSNDNQVSTPGDPNDPVGSSLCCDPVVAFSLSTTPGATSWFYMMTLWRPPVGYDPAAHGLGSDPYIIKNPPSSSSFYLVEKSARTDVDLGELYFIPEPDNWVLLATGLLVIFVGRFSMRSARRSS